MLGGPPSASSSARSRVCRSKVKGRPGIPLASSAVCPWMESSRCSRPCATSSRRNPGRASDVPFVAMQVRVKPRARAWSRISQHVGAEQRLGPHERQVTRAAAPQLVELGARTVSVSGSGSAGAAGSRSRQKRHCWLQRDVMLTMAVRTLAPAPPRSRRPGGPRRTRTAPRSSAAARSTWTPARSRHRPAA